MSNDQPSFETYYDDSSLLFARGLAIHVSSWCVIVTASMEYPSVEFVGNGEITAPDEVGLDLLDEAGALREFPRKITVRILRRPEDFKVLTDKEIGAVCPPPMESWENIHNSSANIELRLYLPESQFDLVSERIRAGADCSCDVSIRSADLAATGDGSTTRWNVVKKKMLHVFEAQFQFGPFPTADAPVTASE